LVAVGRAACLAHVRFGRSASGGAAILAVIVLVMLFVFSKSIVAGV
jgi:hypothetical protein